MRKLGSFGLIVWALLCCVPERAHAGGLFYAGSGTRALGRGAAFHVRADDPMALFYNPAKLADLDGTQFLANFNLGLLDACVDPAGAVDIGASDPTITGGLNDGNSRTTLRDRGTYRENTNPGGTTGGDVTRYGTIPEATTSDLRRSWLGTTMPKVCNETSLLPIPNFVFTYQFFKKRQSWPPSGKHGLTVAFGMVTPGAVAKTTWGKSDGSVSARHATPKQYETLVGNKDGDLGQRLPGGVRPDAVCDPNTDPQGCAQYCDPDNFDSDPECAAGAQFFCNPNIYDCDRLPTPTRHMLVQQDPFAIPLTLGVGYRPLPWISFGAAFTYQAFFIKNSVYAVQGQKSVPETDMKIENTLVDWFVPSFNMSTQVTFLQGLEAMAYFRWNDQIQADTKVKITDSNDSIGGPNGRVPVTSTIKAGEGVQTIVPQPWEVGTGIRFGLPRGGYYKPFQPIPRGDPMVDEWFDIEFNYVLEHNSSIKEFVLKSKMNAFDTFVSYNPADVNSTGNPPPVTAPLTFLDRMTLERKWKNQHVFRVGGDVNVVPGVLALRAGYNYETRGVSPSYQSIDSFPSKRQGVHGGLTWRISKALELSAAYAHLFQETITVRHRDAVNGDGEPLSDRADLRASSPMTGTVPVNAGTYRVSWDIFSLGITQRF